MHSIAGASEARPCALEPHRGPSGRRRAPPSPHVNADAHAHSAAISRDRARYEPSSDPRRVLSESSFLRESGAKDNNPTPVRPSWHGASWRPPSGGQVRLPARRRTEGVSMLPEACRGPASTGSVASPARAGPNHRLSNGPRGRPTRIGLCSPGLLQPAASAMAASAMAASAMAARPRFRSGISRCDAWAVALGVVKLC